MRLIQWLKLPETQDIENLDAPSTTEIHRQIIQKNRFLTQVYLDFYAQFRQSLSQIDTKTLVELGSGGGFIQEVIPNVLTSDVLPVSHVEQRFSALAMPFANNTIDAFFMINVLHHFSEPRAFFKEAYRCLKIGGKVVMIEPANTCWSRFIFQNFHHETFDPDGDWDLPFEAPLSSANDALPFIIFYRDRKMFEQEFPGLNVVKLYPHTPFSYLISGGVSRRPLLPGWMYPFVKALETLLSPCNRFLGMFLTIELRKVEQ